MDIFAQDLRFIVRGLRRSPYVVLVAVLSIGIGLGSALAAYSWMDGLVLHPFPAAADQTRLVGIEVVAPGGMGAWSYPAFSEIERSIHTLTGVAAFRILRASVRTPGELGSTPLLVSTVSAHYFGVLGVRPAIGRIIGSEDVAARAQVAVLGYDFWRARYDGRTDAVGKSVFLNGERFTIVGVAAPGFAGVYTGVAPHFYVAATTEPLISGVNTLDDRKLRSWLLFGRLAPGVTIEAARTEVDAFARRLSGLYGDRPSQGADVMYLRVQFLGKTLSPLFTAMLGVATLLVILASANVAGLLLVRADARKGEFALRRALGASNGPLLRVVLLESALLAVAGSAAGLLFAYSARSGIYAFVPRGALPLSLPVPISGRVFALALLAATLLTTASGIVPALFALRVAPAIALRAGARSLAHGATRARAAIAGGQLAFSVLLLVFAGMFGRGLQRASAIDVGFSDPQHVLLVDTNLRPARVDQSTGPAMVADILSRLRALPGVEYATVASMVPLGFGGRRIVDMKVEGYAPAKNENMTAERAQVGADYAATMRIHVVQGRDLEDGDRASTLPVALINEAFAAHFFPAESPLGKRVDAGPGFATIVGVLHDGKYDRLDEPSHPVIYLPIMQFFAPGMTIHVRTAADPMRYVEPVRRALLAVNVDLPAAQSRTLAEHISASTFVPRTGTLMLGVLSLAALLLSAVGLYGVLAYAVRLRGRELAIRLALGATRSGVRWSIVREGLLVGAGGILAGGILAIVGGPVLRSQVPGIGGADPLVFATATLALALAAVAAAWIPATRATRVDPGAVLRTE
jgi:putative ABC transport system permease protein